MEAAPESQLTGWPILGRTGSRLRPTLSVVLALAAGLALRLWMFTQFFEVQGDSLVYGGIAKNLLLYGRYALVQPNGLLAPTIIRLPGYPFFLVLCFRLFGIENYASAAFVQIVLDLVAGLLLADFVLRIAPSSLRTGAAHCTLWLAMLCPFTAIYAASPLSEGLTLFFITLALWSACRFLDRPRWPTALCFTFAVTATALLRPDGALVAVAFVPSLLIGALRRGHPAPLPRQKLVGIFVVCFLLALAPFAAWTARNWQVFHLLEPLAPHYATEPGEDIHLGWKTWFKTWSLDFNSTYAVSWNVPDSPLDLTQIPARAYDSPQEKADVAALAAEYNANGQEMTPALDARFAQLARQRIQAHPLRYYLWLPLGRMADMWLRPRVENLPIDLDWWVYAHHPDETRLSWFYVVLNLFYLVLGIGGLSMRPRLWQGLLAYLLLRSALLLTVGPPEARYTIECFPILFALAGIALYRFTYTVLLSVLKVNASAGKV